MARREIKLIPIEAKDQKSSYSLEESRSFLQDYNAELIGNTEEHISKISRPSSEIMDGNKMDWGKLGEKLSALPSDVREFRDRELAPLVLEATRLGMAISQSIISKEAMGAKSRDELKSKNGEAVILSEKFEKETGSLESEELKEIAKTTSSYYSYFGGDPDTLKNLYELHRNAGTEKTGYSQEDLLRSIYIGVKYATANSLYYLTHFSVDQLIDAKDTVEKNITEIMLKDGFVDPLTFKE